MVAALPLKATHPDSVPIFWNVSDVFTAPIPFPLEGTAPIRTKLALAGPANAANAVNTKTHLTDFIAVVLLLSQGLDAG
jgi:hypothetical protein